MPSLTAPDLSKIERPNIEMPDIDLSKFELPKMDVGKAVAGAATAVGLMQPRRARWPFVVGAAIAVAVAGWAWMNADMLRRRASEAAQAVNDRIATMRSDTDLDDESIAFPSAETAPSDEDYPNGFGAPSDMASTTGEDLLALDKVTARS